jgi:Domain of unknown function (DUF4159)
MKRAANSFKFTRLVTIVLLTVLAYLSANAQFGGRFRRSMQIRDPERIKEQEIMEKALNPEFTNDVFTFARLKFNEDMGYGYGRGRTWDDDTPEADLNLTYRLFEVTSMKVRPWLNYIDITTKDLPNYPFVYIAAAGQMELDDDQVKAMRSYLLNGGFIMADDFWGDDQWQHIYQQFKQIFPDREPVELTLDHRIFHTVFDFKAEPQIPSVGAFFSTRQSYDPEYSYSQMGHQPHYYAIYDDKQRMMALICHNNHYGDGWEHESEDETYFDKFSEPMAYPMLINILFYTMTH